MSSLDSKLCRAAATNSIHEIKSLIKDGANPNCLNNLNQTPLYCAITHFNDNAVLILLINKADPNFNNGSLLIYAVTKRVILHNSEQRVGKLINSFLSLDRIIKLLVQYNANVYSVDPFGKTPLMILAKANLHQNFDSRLLQSVNVCDILKRTALHWAICGGFKNPALCNTVKSLINKGANINAIDIYKRTPLIYATKQKIHSLDLIRLLLNKGADVNFVDYRGETALIYAAKQNAFGAVNLLIQFGAITSVHDYNNCQRAFTCPVRSSVPFQNDPTLLSRLITFYQDTLASDDPPLTFSTVPTTNLNPKICLNCTTYVFCNDCWDGTCNICFNEKEFHEIIKLWCGHILCVNCYTTWKKKSPLCPYCKSKLFFIQK